MTLEQTLRWNKIKDGLFYFVVYSGISFFCLLIVYPFYYIFINSLNTELIYGAAVFWPSKIGIRNYVTLLSESNIVWSLCLSMIRVAVGGTLAVLVNSMCAFALRRRALRFRNFYLVFFLIPMFFKGGLIPVYLNLKMLGLLDTFFVFIFPEPRLFNFFYVIILMTYFADIPDSVEDSAKIDGAGYFTIYWKIYMPMSVPVIATIFLFAAVFHWETWLDSLYFTHSESLETFAAFLMKAIKKFASIGEDHTGRAESLMEMTHLQGIRFTGMIVAILPVLAIYPFIQKYFVKGIKLGAVKE